MDVTERALAIVADHRVDAVVALGGGSAAGLGKALSARTGIRQVAVPTTYAGSDVTPVLGETRGGVKTTRRDPALASGAVAYDPRADRVDAAQAHPDERPERAGFERARARGHMGARASRCA